MGELVVRTYSQPGRRALALLIIFALSRRHRCRNARVGIFPPWFQPWQGPMVLALAYRSVCAVLVPTSRRY